MRREASVIMLPGSGVREPPRSMKCHRLPLIHNAVYRTSRFPSSWDPPSPFKDLGRGGRAGGAPATQIRESSRGLPPGAERGVGGRPQLRRKVGRWFSLEVASDAPAGCFPQCWNRQKAVFLLPPSAKLQKLLGRRA